MYLFVDAVDFIHSLCPFLVFIVYHSRIFFTKIIIQYGIHMYYCVVSKKAMHIIIYRVFSSLCLMCFCGLLFSSHSFSCICDVNPSKCFRMILLSILFHILSLPLCVWKHDKYLSIYYDFSGKFNIGCFNTGATSFFCCSHFYEGSLQNGNNTWNVCNLHVVNVI